MINYQSIVLFATAGVYFILCAIVHTKGERKPSAQVFNQFLIGVVLWAVSLGMFYVSTTNISSLFWLKVMHVGLKPGSRLLFFSSLSFIRRKNGNSRKG